MNFTTDPAALKALRAQNLRNKRAIQAKRANDAKTNAAIKGIPHAGKFPAPYKYG